MTNKNKHTISPQTLLIIFITITALILSSSIFDYHKSKNEITSLLINHSKAFLASLKSASENAKLSDEMIEKSIEERLLNNANFIKKLYDSKKLNTKNLNEIAEENNLFRINIYSKDGKRILSNDAPGMQFGRGPGNPPRLYLQDIFKGKKQQVTIGLKSARWNKNYRFVVAVAASDSSAISINMEADELRAFKKDIGMKALFDNVINSKAIKYISLIDSMQIENLSAEQITENYFSSDFIDSDSLEIFEAKSSFYFKNNFAGILKIGIDASTYNQVLNNIIIRSIISGILLVVFGSALLALVFSKQSYKLLERQYDSIETFSKNIIQSVSDAIIVYNAGGEINLVNESAGKLLSIENISGKRIEEVFPENVTARLNNKNFDTEFFNLEFNGELLFLIISKSSFYDENEKSNSILVIKDISKQKELEEQINKKDKLAAMGELASGVAHEVRNPLNAIGTIVQQLKKDFAPQNNKEEYINLTEVVYKEVKRINETVQNFLTFAKPLAIFPTEVDLNDIIDQMKMQFSSILKESDIELSVNNSLSETLLLDKNQIKQVFINLIQNSVDELKNGGRIYIAITDDKWDCLIRFNDNGQGIPKDKIDHIFNLYYTTKAQGSGIGLSIVQKIIHEHGGKISVESNYETGTTFFIKLPKKRKQHE